MSLYMSLYCTVSDILRDIGRKSPFEPSLPHLFSAPFRGALAGGVVYVILDVVMFVELQLVTDRKTDKQTDTRLQHIPH